MRQSATFTLANSVTVTASGPSKLAFTNAALTGVVNQCLGPIGIQTQNASSVPTNVTSDTTVNLATDNGGTGAGSFFSDDVCAAGISSVSIATGGNSASFYYKAPARGDGTHDLTVSASGLTSATQTQTINKANQTISVTLERAGQRDIQHDIQRDGDSVVRAGRGDHGQRRVLAPTGGTNAATILMTSGTGTCTVHYNQAGDANYNAATGGHGRGHGAEG